VWDVAGVSCVLAKWLRRKDHSCSVIIRKGYDTLGFFDFYKEQVIDLEGRDFDYVAVGMAAEYDIIHVNSDFRLAKRLKTAYPDKKVVLEYHGSDARGNHKHIREPYEIGLDKILVSTVDLYDYVYGAEWLPNPVDIEHFKVSEHKPGALQIKTKNQVMALDTPFSLDIIFRDSNPIMYKDMPKLLENYHMYIDIKNYADVGLLKPLSKTALEALATGMKVYNSDRLIVQGLPSRHHPDSVTDKLLEIYNILNDK
jgi:hypothetical protein